jgi:hypothetical protein
MASIIVVSGKGLCTIMLIESRATVCEINVLGDKNPISMGRAMEKRQLNF